MIDRMHANPPRSTAEIIDLDSYFKRLDGRPEPRPPFDPTDKNALTVEHLGEFHWRFLAGDKVTGWVNDRVVVERNGAVRADTQWDTPEHAAVFRDAYVAFLRGRGLDPRATTDGTKVRVDYETGR
jgi:hypothetical protein